MYSLEIEYLYSISILDALTNSRDILVEALLNNEITEPTEEEFKELEENDRKRSSIKSDLTMSQGRRYNDGKNGKLNINKKFLPYDQTRIKLKTPINGIDYINASWIQKANNIYDDVYEFLSSSKINFILTQDPTPDTQQHYFQMMYEQKVDLAVHVGCNENLAQWSKISYGKITIELVERTKLMDYLTRENIDIYIKHERSVINHRMMVYHFTSWPSNDQFESKDSKNFLTLDKT